MKFFYTCLLLVSLTLFSLQLNGQSAEPVVEKSEIEVPEESEEEGISVSGFVDAYYQYTSNQVVLPTSFTEQIDAFALGMANVVFSGNKGKVDFVADVAFGPRAEVANGGEGTLQAIKQLYVSYSPSEKISLTLGNFSTFLGYELIDAPGNVNYSTSYLFSNGPFYHTGLKADVALGENFGLMLGVFNDTDSKIDEVAGKHLGVQLSTTQGDWSAYLNFLYGTEEEIEGSDANLMESEIDLTTTYQVSPGLMLGLNVAKYDTQFDGRSLGGFFGTALYSTITTSDAFALGLRAEYFGIQDGDDAIEDDSVISLTASGNISIGALRIIPEVRYDTANRDVFSPIDNIEAFEGSVLSLILATVYNF